MKQRNIKNFSIMVLLAMLVISVVMNIVFSCKIRHLENTYTGEIKWEEKIDSSPKPISETKTKLVSIPFVVLAGDNSKRSPPGTDTIYIDNKQDSVASVQLTQKVYRDSNYVAYVSGFMPRLDSIKIKYPTLAQTMPPPGSKTHTKKIGLGAIAGVGYGFSSRRFEPFVGFGISYKIY